MSFSDYEPQCDGRSQYSRIIRGCCRRKRALNMLNNMTSQTAASRSYQERHLKILIKYLAVAVQYTLHSCGPKTSDAQRLEADTVWCPPLSPGFDSTVKSLGSFQQKVRETGVSRLRSLGHHLSSLPTHQANFSSTYPSLISHSFSASISSTAQLGAFHI